LDRACEIFEASKPTLRHDLRIIRDDLQLVNLVLDCAYKPDHMDAHAVELLNRMYTCLPELKVEEDLERRMQALDVALAACETLVHYGIVMSLKEIRDLAKRTDRQRSLLQRLARSKSTGAPTSQWRDLLEHMLELHSLNVLDSIPLKDVYAEFIAAVLSAGGNVIWFCSDSVLRLLLMQSFHAEFRLAKDILFPQASRLPQQTGQPVVQPTQQTAPPLSQAIVDALVLNAAKEYFDNADTADADNVSIQMALEW
jgi:hypothetical protein